MAVSAWLGVVAALRSCWATASWRPTSDWAGLLGGSLQYRHTWVRLSQPMASGLRCACVLLFPVLAAPCTSAFCWLTSITAVPNCLSAWLRNGH
eukprot:1439369-Lingulodinium_polyedra.AAC.1